jgi:hypothetical protein
MGIEKLFTVIGMRWLLFDGDGGDAHYPPISSHMYPLALSF